jgi:hypothetical protein
MGKKRIAEKTEEELIKEAEKLGKKRNKNKNSQKSKRGKNLYFFFL